MIRQLMESIVYRRWDPIIGNAVGDDVLSVCKRGGFPGFMPHELFLYKMD